MDIRLTSKIIVIKKIYLSIISHIHTSEVKPFFQPIPQTLFSYSFQSKWVVFSKAKVQAHF